MCIDYDHDILYWYSRLTDSLNHYGMMCEYKCTIAKRDLHY